MAPPQRMRDGMAGRLLNSNPRRMWQYAAVAPFDVFAILPIKRYKSRCPDWHRNRSLPTVKFKAQDCLWRWRSLAQSKQSTVARMWHLSVETRPRAPLHVFSSHGWHSSNFCGLALFCAQWDIKHTARSGLVACGAGRLVGGHRKTTGWMMITTLQICKWISASNFHTSWNMPFNSWEMFGNPGSHAVLSGAN